VADSPPISPLYSRYSPTKTIRGHKGEFDFYQRNIPLSKYKKQLKIAFEGLLNFMGFSNLYDTISKYKVIEKINTVGMKMLKI